MKVIGKKHAFYGSNEENPDYEPNAYESFEEQSEESENDRSVRATQEKLARELKKIEQSAEKSQYHDRGHHKKESWRDSTHFFGLEAHAEFLFEIRVQPYFAHHHGFSCDKKNRYVTFLSTLHTQKAVHETPEHK